jgi:2'-5' RNA ligase
LERADAVLGKRSDQQLASETRKSATDRLFFEIFPDMSAATRMASVADKLRIEHGLVGRVVPAARLHVTLEFLGDYAGLPLNIVASACDAAASIAMPACEVVFDRAASLSGGRHVKPFVLFGQAGLAALSILQGNLRRALDAAGLAPASRIGYNPHLTMLYDPRSIAERPVEPTTWTVQEFVLVHSRVGRRQYSMLGTWPLHK